MSIESFTTYNKQTGNRGWTSKANNIHAPTINADARNAASALAGIHASKKAGNKSGIVSTLFGNLFGGGGGGGGVSGFFGNLFGGTGSQMMGKAAIFNVLGSFLGGLDKTQEKLDARRIDVQEKIGMGQIANQKLQAENAIRETGLSSTYMGWTPEQANVPGIFEGTPGLVVGDAPTQVASNSAGIIGGSNQGMITQAKQRQV